MIERRDMTRMDVKTAPKKQQKLRQEATLRTTRLRVLHERIQDPRGWENSSVGPQWPGTRANKLRRFRSLGKSPLEASTV